MRGGAAKVAWQLKVGLEQRGHQAAMLVGEKFSVDPAVQLLNDKKSLGGRLRRKLAYWLANDIEVFRSDQILATPQFRQADVVHCHNLHSYYFNLTTLAKIARHKPVVWTFHDMWPLTAHCAHSFGGTIKDGFFQCPDKAIFPPLAWHNEKHLEKLKRRVYQQASFHIVAPSQWLKTKVSQSLLADQPISLIYNGIDASIFRLQDRARMRAQLGLPPDKKIILSVIKKGWRNPWKGAKFVDHTRQYYRNRPELIFLNIGSDIPSVSDPVRLAQYYAAADVLLYPAIADNCPLVVLEAQACGLPVVAFATGGIPELVQHQVSGWIASYQDTAGLIAGLEFVLKHKLGWQFNRRFSFQTMLANYLKLYEQLARQGFGSQSIIE